ncbi:MAG TPA: trehalose-6-phosphate synthase [Roseateles sp.]|nr:trehalose-6-phosphate synthase [Roseateles sp.]HWT54370.1 trehalose-6-phosphate synthase [Rhodocyclaceae bacterium]
MRLSLRFVLPLVLVLAGLAYIVVPLVDQLTLRWSVRDLNTRAALVARTIEEPLYEEIESGSTQKLLKRFNDISEDERLYALGYCPTQESVMIATKIMPKEIRCNNLDHYVGSDGYVLHTEREMIHVAVRPMETGGAMILLQDMGYFVERSQQTKLYIYAFFVGLAILISLITVFIARLSLRGWNEGLRLLVRGKLPGEPVSATATPAPPELRPIARDLQRLIRELESENRTRDESQINWNPDALKAMLRGELRGEDIIVVSNREPYIHMEKDGKVEVQRPASGLVTALEPIMRACSGTWIAHGSGNADKASVDAHDRVAVPPEKPAYQIRRVWLTPEQEAGYYYGLANEGLWPLCHIAHVCPIFRSSDWEHYVAANQLFADAVVQEAKTLDPIVLVQDYHLALVPRMVREMLPEATIITFWHIPWPNPESFAICPWRERIIDGLLGSSILGFHTQFHCNNFVDTVDRFMEARVDRESFEVTSGGKQTAVRRFPISIDWPPDPLAMEKSAEDCRREIRALNGLPENQLLGIGVDRLDYTKGIIERFRAVERLFELQPSWIGRFTFIQIAAPTRSSIGEYQNYETLVRAAAERINLRFGKEGAPAILLKIQYHGPREVYEYYRASELCFVSSLHDGMNLVAKEFVAARNDNQGVLVLSEFTGAARELPEALIVNPYDADQCAAALHLALTMDPMEQRDRIRLMRSLIAEFNVYRWAGRMLLDAATMRRRMRLLGDTTIKAA